MDETRLKRMVSSLPKGEQGRELALFLEALSVERGLTSPTKETLIEELKISEDAFDAAAGKLMGMGAVYLISGVKYGKQVAYYILCPFVKTKTKTSNERKRH